jgi:hypothetical protein
MRAFSRCLFALSFVGVILAAPSAQAATMYTYSGNNFSIFTGTAFDRTMSISGSFTMSDALPANQTISFFSPLSFSFSDGVGTITNLDVGLVIFQRVTTDNSGNISGWDFQVSAGDFTIPGQQTNTIISGSNTGDFGELTTCTARSSIGTCTATDGQFGISPSISSGTWSSALVPTPLPAALPLFATGLGALGLLGWRRKKKTQAA